MTHRYMTFHVDPARPEQTLEFCACQIEMMADLLSTGGELNLGERAIAGMADMLFAVSAAMTEVQELVHAGRAVAA